MIAVVLLFSTSSFSQGLAIGVKGGATLNKLTGKAWKDQFSFGYHVGAFLSLKLSGKLGIQPEVMLNQVNMDTSSSFSSVYQFNHLNNVKLNYLTIPILLNYNMTKMFALQAGPQFGILMDKNKNLLQNGKDAFKSGDFSMVGGLQVKLIGFRIYGRYVVGLNDISNIGSSDKWKSQSIQLGVGVAL